MSTDEKMENEVLNNNPLVEGGAELVPSTEEATQTEPVFRVEPPLSNKEEKTSESAEGQHVSEVVDAVANQAEQLVSPLEDTAKEVAVETKQAVENTASQIDEAVTEKLEQAVPVAEEAAKQVEEAVTEKIEQAAPVVQQTVAQTEQVVSQAAVQAEQAVEKAVEKVEEKLSAAERIKQNVNKHKPEKKQKTGNNGEDGGKKHSAFIIVIVILFMLLVLGLGYAFFQRRVKLNLDKYVSVNFSGYEGYGEAEVVFDEDAFLADYKKKIKVKKKKNSFAGEMLEDYTAEEFLYEYYISGNWELDGENGKYKNGDKARFNWDLDKDEIEELFRVKIQDSSKEFTVENLEKVESFDAFENFEIEFMGTAPDGSAEWDGKGIMDGSKGLYFSVNPSEGLSNGDKITVRVEPQEYLDKFIQRTGKAPKETEKEYTVEGLLSYIESGSQVDSALLTRMKGEVEDLFMSDLAREDDTVEFISAEYQGYYFLKAKTALAYRQNAFYPVYKVTIRITLPEDNFVQDYSYYVTGEFENILDEGNGKVSVDVNEMGSLYNSFTIDTGVGQWFTARYYLDGFETLDSLRTEVVSKNLSNYNVEEKIESNEAGTEASAETESAAEESTEAETTANS